MNARFQETESTSLPNPGEAPRQRRALRRAIAAAAGIAALLALAVLYAYLHRTPPPAQRYLTAPAERGTVAPKVVASGTVNPVTIVQVGSRVSGVIVEVGCDFNTRVRAGQRCALIDPRLYETAVSQESANLGAARAQLAKDMAALDYAAAAYQRSLDLRRKGFISQEAVDSASNTRRQAETQADVDRAQVRQHAATLQAAQVNLGYTSITSPVDGTVVSRNVTRGQTVAASFQTPTLFLIAADLAKMQVDTNVSEADIGRVALGNEALFSVESFPERRFSGVVTQVRQAPQTVQNVVTYDVVVSVDNTDLALKPGMTASMRIVTARSENALRVPTRALRYKPASREAASSSPASPRRPGEGAVWVLRDGAPSRLTLATGLDDDTWTEVTGGDLHEGDQVILSERAAPQADKAGPAAGPRLPRL
ncbi:efflux RND transporter periplasmic adaptor subunit [Noviherbaspirillum galbum]|uniref:Efflux RND transporter periplasmic adaptor subunit n=1 Tax=Noviherbaspirillum galbum TaxID=2709383 RepID=A0A6B3SU05_9BURK|nr:efflux RND transporter periplasmic adaptor subunit [Noviherbaspirillum galbum]NEX62356.1 efflux RND transporter periplasmic adaptor subunit [Noviherbaspirillum galbum]